MRFTRIHCWAFWAQPLHAERNTRGGSLELRLVRRLPRGAQRRQTTPGPPTTQPPTPQVRLLAERQASVAEFRLQMDQQTGRRAAGGAEAAREAEVLALSKRLNQKMARRRADRGAGRATLGGMGVLHSGGVLRDPRPGCACSGCARGALGIPPGLSCRDPPVSSRVSSRASSQPDHHAMRKPPRSKHHSGGAQTQMAPHWPASPSTRRPSRPPTHAETGDATQLEINENNSLKTKLKPQRKPQLKTPLETPLKPPL